MRAWLGLAAILLLARGEAQRREDTRMIGLVDVFDWDSIRAHAHTHARHSRSAVDKWIVGRFVALRETVSF